jgi:hypothetical protein
MKRDPKFGYHWIWILPVYWLLAIYFKCFDKLHQKIHQRKIQKLLQKPLILNT